MPTLLPSPSLALPALVASLAAVLATPLAAAPPPPGPALARAAGPAAEADARAVGWVGAWEVDGGGARVLEGGGGLLTLDLPWDAADGPSSVRVAGVVQGAGAVALHGALPGAVGLRERLGPEVVAPRAGEAVVVVARRGADDPDGREVAEVEVRAGRRTHRERWRRWGSPRVEVLACSADGRAWRPKADGALAVRYRVAGRPVALRLEVHALDIEVERAAFTSPSEHRVALEREGRRRAAVARLPLGRDAATTRVVVHARPLEGGEPVAPGEHQVTWDGRDDTAARRLPMGGAYLVVVRAEGWAARGERRLEVAPPEVRHLAPNWPEKRSAAGEALDPGRDRESQHRLLGKRLPALGFGDLAPHRPEVRVPDLADALRRSAMVFVATHGSTARGRPLLLYAGAKDRVEVPEHVETFGSSELTWEVEYVRDAAGKHEDKPLRDLHVVVLWACWVGGGELPGRLVGLGVDQVVGFSAAILAAPHGVDAFLRALVAALLGEDPERAGVRQAPLAVPAASRVAAAFATRRAWDGLPEELKRKLRQEGCRPYEECLVSYPPREDRVPMDPTDDFAQVAHWGNSTN